MKISPYFKKAKAFLWFILIIIIGGLGALAYYSKPAPLIESKEINPSLTSSHLPLDDSEVSTIERDFFNDLDDGRLDDFTFYDAAIIASGIIREEDIDFYKKKLNKIKDEAFRAMWIANLKRLLTFKGKDFLAKQLLFWLHDNYLESYRKDATFLRNILDSGEFNCLSSSVLYAILARDIGLNIQGVLAPEHAFCILIADKEDIDIETTVRYGFNPGTKEIERLKNETSYIYVPKKNYAERKIIDIYHLIGMFYSNQLGLLMPTAELQPGKFEKNLPEFKKGYYFDPTSEIFKQNIASSFNNLAILAMDKGDFEVARVYIDKGKDFAPDDKRWQELTRSYYANQAHEATKRGDYYKAINIYEDGLFELPDEEILVEGIKIAYQNMAVNEFNLKNYDAAIRICREGLMVGGSNYKVDTKLKELIKKANEGIQIDYYNKAVNAFNARNFNAAIRICDEGLSVSRDSSISYKLRSLKQEAQKYLSK